MTIFSTYYYVIKMVVFLLFSEIGAFENFGSIDILNETQGYLSECPGSTKPAFIKPRTLQRLGIMVVDGVESKIEYKRVYNYYQTKELSKDPHLDFKNKKTIFFFCGYIDTAEGAISTIMAKAYLSQGYNVLLLDAYWFLFSDYAVSVRYMRPVGKFLAEMLADQTDLDPKHLEFCGLSLGAHTMSFVAKNYQQITGRKVSKLIGLDPAGPCFRNLGPKERIDASDAEFVLAIHTNIDEYGMPVPLAHVDFYINGGEHQPSDFYWMPCTATCSHMRAFFLWLSVLYSPNYFIGLKCDSINQARKHQCYDRVPRETNIISNTKIDVNNTGIFYVATDNNWPYYLGLKGLRKEFQFFYRKLTSYNKADVIEV